MPQLGSFGRYFAFKQRSGDCEVMNKVGFRLEDSHLVKFNDFVIDTSSNR